ncbi:MAG: HAD family hydrolase [Bacteroidales bacterium]|nr:HAD family hydrolase [Bacteroidales bacterium]
MNRQIPHHPKAFLFDMDGTLYDSMPNHASSWYQMICEHGIPCTPEEFYLYEGATGHFTVNLLIRRAFGRDATDEEVQSYYERKAEIFRSKPAPGVMPGALDLVRAVESLPWKPQTILVTGSAQGSLLGMLDSDFPGAFPIERRVTALNVKRGKPNPDPFLQGAKLAGVKPEECVVIENAPLGVMAGDRAGCFTVAVATGPTPHEKLAEAGADLIFSSMPECAAQLPEMLCNS